MSNTTDDRYLNLEKKVIEIDSKQKVLEARIDQDLTNIYDLLKKIEVRLIGGGLDGNTLGLTAEMRDLKYEMGQHTIQTTKLQTTVDEIKTQLIPSQQIIKDVAALQTKLQEYDKQKEQDNKQKYIGYGILLAAGWIINKIAPFIEKLIP